MKLSDWLYLAAAMLAVLETLRSVAFWQWDKGLNCFGPDTVKQEQAMAFKVGLAYLAMVYLSWKLFNLTAGGWWIAPLIVDLAIFILMFVRHIIHYDD